MTHNVQTLLNTLDDLQAQRRLALAEGRYSDWDKCSNFADNIESELKHKGLTVYLEYEEDGSSTHHVQKPFGF